MNPLEPIVVSDNSDMDISDSDEESVIGVLDSNQARKNGLLNVDQGIASTSASNSQPLHLGGSSSSHRNQYTQHVAPDLRWNEYHSVENLQVSPTLCFSGNDYGPLAVDHSLSYIIDLINDIDALDSLDDVEDLYGPFPASTVSFNSPREASPARDSRIAARQQELARQQEIAKLKVLIAEKEKLKKLELERQRRRDQPTIAGEASRKLAHPSTPSPPPRSQVKSSMVLDSNPKADEPMHSSIIPPQVLIQHQQPNLQSAVPPPNRPQEPRLKMQIDQSDSNYTSGSVGSPNGQELQRSIDAVTKEIDDSKAVLAAVLNDSDVDMSSPESMNGVTELDLDTHPVSTPVEDMEIQDGYDSDTSQSSYVTAPTSPEGEDLEDEMASLQAAINEYNSKLERIQKERKMAHVKVLGLQVRLSLQKNRKASAAATSASAVTASKDVRNNAKDNLLRRRPMSQRRAHIEKPIPPRKVARRAPEVSGPLLTPPTFGHSHPMPEDLPPRNIPPTPPSRTRPGRYSQSPRSLQSKNSGQFSGVNPIVDSNKLGNYLQEIEELVKLRLSSDVKAVRATHPLIRTPQQPIRLITVDGFTMGLDSVLLKKRRQTKPPSGKNPESISDNLSLSKLEQKDDISNHDIVFSSVLANVILMKQQQSPSTLSIPIQSRLDQITGSISPDAIRNIHSIGHWGYLPMERPQQIALKAAQDYPECELLWALYAELSLYCHGNSASYTSDIEAIDSGSSDSVEITWQKLRATPTTAEWLKVTSRYLQNLKTKAIAQDSGELRNLSGKATEILLRVMRFKGIEATLQLLVERQSVIDQEQVDPIALEKMSSSVYLDDHDIYIVWMSVLYYYIFCKIPDSISRHWYTGLVTAGRPTTAKPLFTINWSEVVAEAPLSRQEQIGTTNLLLSMVRFFGKKARGNDTKRPLLMGAWQTLLDFLAHIECYKKAGTLTLLRKGLDIKALLPELYGTAAYLEMQVKGQDEAIERLQTHTASLSDMPHKLILAYRSAHMLALSESSPHDKLCEAARLIGLPMEDIYDMSGMPSNEAGNVQVDFVRRLYLNALGMDPTPPAPAKPAFQKGGMASCFKSAAFGWINLIFLTQISLWLYPNPVLQSTLLQQLRTAREMAIDAVQSDEAKLLLVKYTKYYVHCFQQ